MTDDRSIEYTELHNWMRYLLEYRSKVFNFCVVFNTALITLTLEQISTRSGKVILGIIAAIVTSLFFLAELRLTSTFSIYRDQLLEVEKHFCYSSLTQMNAKIKRAKIKLRMIFPLIYVFFILLWIVLLIFGFPSNP